MATLLESFFDTTTTTTTSRETAAEADGAAESPSDKGERNGESRNPPWTVAPPIPAADIQAGTGWPFHPPLTGINAERLPVLYIMRIYSHLFLLLFRGNYPPPRIQLDKKSTAPLNRIHSLVDGGRLENLLFQFGEFLRQKLQNLEWQAWGIIERGGYCAGLPVYVAHAQDKSIISAIDWMWPLFQDVLIYYVPTESQSSRKPLDGGDDDERWPRVLLHLLLTWSIHTSSRVSIH